MLLKWYKYINILSIDVVAGACISSLFMARWLNVELEISTVALLGLSVWLIYTFDHLLDAKKIKHQASTCRHRFHQINFIPLTWACIFSLMLICVLIFIVPPVTVVWGIALACLVGAYFLLLHLLNINSVYHKEVMIAVIYTAGILVGPLSIYEGKLNMSFYIIFLQFAALALTNILLFALIEIKADLYDNSPSLVRLLGSSGISKILRGFIIFQMVASVILFLTSEFVLLEATFLVMGALLGLLLFVPRVYSNTELSRYIGDAVFILPGLILLIL